MKVAPGARSPEFIMSSGISPKRGKSYGGSAKMKSNLAFVLVMNLNTSPFIRFRLFSPSCCATLRIKPYCIPLFSTAVTDAHPRDSSSKLMAPVPANRSSAFIPSSSMRFSMTLKMFSRAKSVVGRAVMFLRRIAFFHIYL